jgi:ElaB/YqjD/DUF883 family membrane-anchored ribosome-binding protein
MRTDNPQARDIAQQELRDMLASTEALLAALGDQTGEGIDELRARLTNTISDVKSALGTSFVASAREKIAQARDTVTQVNEFVTEKPWTAVAIGAGIGLLAGLLLKD